MLGNGVLTAGACGVVTVRLVPEVVAEADAAGLGTKIVLTIGPWIL